VDPNDESYYADLAPNDEIGRKARRKFLEVSEAKIAEVTPLLPLASLAAPVSRLSLLSLLSRLSRFSRLSRLLRLSKVLCVVDCAHVCVVRVYTCIFFSEAS
jgi:hypothetical protein